MSVNLQDQIMIMEQKEQELLASGRTDAAHQDDLNSVRCRLSELRHELAQTEQEKAERIQQQEEKIATIDLPYNFDEIFDNTRANKLISGVIQQFQRQAYEEQNEEIERLHQLYKEQLRAANDRETQLQRQNDELQARLTEKSEQLTEALNRNSQLVLEKQDAESKRDNAVNELDQVRAELDRMNRNRNQKIEPSANLDELVAKAKEGRIKSAAELAVENGLGFRGKITLPEIPKTEVSQFRLEFHNQAQSSSDQFSTTQAPEIVTENQFQLPIVDIPTPPIAGLAQGEPVRQGEHAETGDVTIEARVAALEHRMNVLEGRVA